MGGATQRQLLLRVYLPLGNGVMADPGIIVFIGAWNVFLWPFLVVTKPEMMNITAAITQAQDYWGVGGVASALLAGLPVAVIYLLSQLHVTQAVMMSSELKG